MTADATSEPSRPGQIKWEVKSIKEMSAEATEKRKNAIVPNLPKLSQIRNFDEDLEMEQRSIAAKAMRNPFVPIGMLATVGALTYGLYAFRKRDSRLQQIMMRWRVAAQSFTILSLIGGFMFYASDSSRSQSLNRDELMEEARKKRFEEEKKRIEMEKQRMTDKIKQKEDKMQRGYCREAKVSSNDNLEDSTKDTAEKRIGGHYHKTPAHASWKSTSFVPQMPIINEVGGSKDPRIRDKAIQKSLNNPFVPIGIAATTIVLIRGLFAMTKGNSKQSQLMMRYRVGFQGFTIMALVVGFTWTAYTTDQADKND